MEREELPRQDQVLIGKEISRMNMGHWLSSALDSEPWATIRLENGMDAYDPVTGLNVFDKEGNPVSPNDSRAVICRRIPKIG